ncbi:MAG: putative molybdenum carrier protein [Verrucomicrobiales bacterium]
MIITEIISGGQTGADRAGLDWALANRVAHSGWCPAGRFSEDGPIESRYLLTETPSEGYAQRTEWNVRDSDGTVIFSVDSQLRGGSSLTRDLAKKWHRPCLHLSQLKTKNPVETLVEFVESNFIQKLNIAGPRESSEPEIAIYLTEVLDAAFG